MSKKKIIFFSTGRSDFYLMSLILKKIKNNHKFKCYFVATGNHYERSKGNTYKEVLKKGFNIDFKVPYNLKNDTNREIAYEISKSIRKNFDILSKVKPDLVMILGDRYELMPIACIALLLNIPIAHLHGGEVTEGAFDDSIRHSISKLSNIHFVTNQIYKKRLMRMGENPNIIFDVGGIGAELIAKEKKFNKKQIEKLLKVKLNKKIIMVSLHPETKSKNTNYLSLFKVLKKFKKDFLIIFTSPNSDPGSKLILREILKFQKYNNSYYIENLGSRLYHSLLRYAKILIGNSSSGLLEAPLLNVPSVVNIGNRQKGRLLENNILNCKFNEKEILKTINRALKRNKNNNKVKYYKNKKASEKILKILSKLQFNKIKIKKFYDIK